MNLPSFTGLFQRRRVEHAALPRPDVSAREAWSIVAPRCAAGDTLLPVGIASTMQPGRQQIGRASLLRDGRITHDTAWRFCFRPPDGTRQLNVWLSGGGELTFEKQRIKVFRLDANGERMRPKALQENWLDSPEVWKIAQSRPSLQPDHYPPLSGVSLQLVEWFENRRWCWAAWHRFLVEGSRDGATALIVIDAVSGDVLQEEVTRYSGGMPVSRS